QDCDGLLDPDETDCSVCGDGFVTAGEDCDDGGTISGDGCSSDCIVETGGLIITEVHTFGLAPGGDGEQWVEIKNHTSNAVVDLARMAPQLRRKTGATFSLAHCVAAGTSSLSPGQFAVISLGPELLSDGTPADYFCPNAFQLSAEGDLLEILRADGQTVIEALDFRNFSCLNQQAGSYGISRSLERVDPDNAANSNIPSSWCIASASSSYANSGNHFGSPGEVGSCSEYLCDGIDDDCDSETDEALADGDGDGVCDAVDCDPEELSCSIDCITDIDSDGVPDCKDGCLDEDLDGWGLAGGATVSTCNTLNGAVVPDCDDTQPSVHPGGNETPSAGVCTNGLDEDCDGFADCTDAACESSTVCSGETCAGAITVECGSTVVLEPTTNAFDCGSGVDGVVHFVADTNESISVMVENIGRLQYGASIFEGTCTDASCISPTGTVLTTCQTPTAETVDVSEGISYFFVIDALGECGNIGTNEVSLQVLCAERCDTGVDEDGDGYTSCSDPDCANDVVCATADTDSDGVPNGLEVTCASDPANPVDVPSADDIADVDDDGLLGCEDDNDDGDPVLDADEDTCAIGAKNDATIYPGAPKQCQTQNVDADCNGLIDTSEDICGAIEQQCGDEEDNDNDGLVDCLDLDCVGNIICALKDFDSDGVSNAIEVACLTKPNDPNSFPTPFEVSDLDGDGQPNCQDADDDADSYADIEEILCGSDPSSGSSIPTDTDGDDQCNPSDPDDDGDGFGDEFELDCGSSPLDPSEIPTSIAYDLDQDGLCDAKDLDIDGDGWSNGIEETCGTNLLDAALNPTTQGLDGDEDLLCDAIDTDDDNDGWSDELEGLCLTSKTDANSVPADADLDGICDLLDEDTDGDGWPDELEVQCGSDPLLDVSNPTADG
ncbi:MAG: MopE-related protein, partial [Myxococcota bacterium]|nr:MopE-related protein [Myxococcota bacterium]